MGELCRACLDTIGPTLSERLFLVVPTGLSDGSVMEEGVDSVASRVRALRNGCSKRDTEDTSKSVAEGNLTCGFSKVAIL